MGAVVSTVLMNGSNQLVASISAEKEGDKCVMYMCKYGCLANNVRDTVIEFIMD